MSDRSNSSKYLVWIGDRCWSSQLPSADLRIDALPLSQLGFIVTSYANSLFGATVLYEDCVLWLENNIKRYVNRHVMVDAVPAGVQMAFPAPTKSIPFSYSTFPSVAKKVPRATWLVVRRFSDMPSFVIKNRECPGSIADTNSASVYGAFVEAQTASTW